MFDRTVRDQQAMFEIKILPLLCSGIDCLSNELPVFRMHSFEYPFQGRLGCRFEFEYPKSLVGPIDFPAGNMPAETACVAQFLRFGQVSFTASQLPFRLLCSGDIHHRPNKLDDSW